ncbi:MAG: septum formation initiator family protein [Candidatus Omnitrophota bacterium]|nr:septum formation initiator family protein [Candidatus Omnitrophota bacterium]MBU2529169.1 septum formation initiator family protein [bacterium]MBU3930561.1 septum formation initiator family protein [bacterium]MBU4123414.1 septum formation initiator family protein [bacterium]
MNDEQKRRLFYLLAVVFFLAAAFGNQHFSRFLIYRKNRKILELKIAELDRQNAVLKKQLEMFEKNPEAAYYKLAREKYGMIEPGEVKYRFIGGGEE